MDISFPELVTRIRRVEPRQHGGERFLYSVAQVLISFCPDCSKSVCEALQMRLVSLRPVIWPDLSSHAVH